MCLCKIFVSKKIERIVLFRDVDHYNNLFATILTEFSIVIGNISLSK